jgi:quercetin dioxygenase-like cupin family protein
MTVGELPLHLRTLTGPATSAESIDAESTDMPRALCEVHSALAEAACAPPGIVWKLAESGRQLDANLVSLRAGQVIDTHTESALDVLVLVIAGNGTFATVSEPLPLTGGSLVWLPRGSTRALTAGPNGLSYLTVHQRRPGMQIRSRP